MRNKAIAYLLLLTGVASASAQPAVQSVRELLELDANKALAAERGKAPIGADAAPVITTQSPPTKTAEIPLGQPRQAASDVIKVLAIYGSAERNTAVLSINGNRKIYRPGQQIADGDRDLPGAYSLLSIDGTCVRIQRRSKPNKTSSAAREESHCFVPADLPEVTVARESSAGRQPAANVPQSGAYSPSLLQSAGGPVIIPAPFGR